MFDERKDYHTTEQEIRYFRGMIRGKFVMRPPEVSKLTLIKNYIRSAKRRRAWDGGDTSVKWSECIREAEKALQEELYDQVF